MNSNLAKMVGKTTKEIKVGVDCIMIHLFWSDVMWSIVGLGGRDSTVL